MNSVQENKNELEAAVRYCESAISRAKATIESMEFRQQAASKAWHEQTGREAALEREVTRLKGIIAEGNNVIDEGKDDRAKLVKKLAFMTDEYDKMKGYADKLVDEKVELEERYDEAKTNMALMTDEIAKLNDQVEELGKAYNNEIHETNVWKKAHRELKETNNLQKEQIEMFQRKMSRMNEVSNRSVLDRD